MVGPERGRGIEGHALGDVVVGGRVVVVGVVVDDGWRHRERRQGGDGDHGGGGHHGVEDERQAVGHVPVGGAGERRGVAWRSGGGGGREGRRCQRITLQWRLKLVASCD